MALMQDTSTRILTNYKIQTLQVVYIQFRTSQWSREYHNIKLDKTCNRKGLKLIPGIVNKRFSSSRGQPLKTRKWTISFKMLLKIQLCLTKFLKFNSHLNKGYTLAKISKFRESLPLNKSRVTTPQLSFLS